MVLGQSKSVNILKEHFQSQSFGSFRVEPTLDISPERCVAEAASHIDQRERSTVRLRIVLAVFLLILLASGVFAAILAFDEPLARLRLARQVQTFRERNDSPTSRFAPERLKELRGIQKHPLFVSLNDSDQRFIRNRLTEAEAYETFTRRLSATLIGPAEVRSEDELIALDLELAGPLTPPAEYDWHDTPSDQLYRKWTADVALLKRYRLQASSGYREAIERITDLLLAPRLDADTARAALVDVQVNDLPQTLPESQTLSMPRGEALPSKAILESGLVERARSDWQTIREQLKLWLAVLEALGAMTLIPI
jgi:hypothetical protein